MPLPLGIPEEYPAGQIPALGMDMKRPFLSDSIFFQKNDKIRNLILCECVIGLINY